MSPWLLGYDLNPGALSVQQLGLSNWHDDRVCWALLLAKRVSMSLSGGRAGSSARC